MDKQIILERLLKEFGNPFYKMIPEKHDAGEWMLIDLRKKEWKMPSSFNFGKTYELPVALELNEKYPLHLQFFPNGNFMENFSMKRGDPSKGIVGKGRANGDRWNAFIIDLDFVESWFETMEEYREYISIQIGDFLPTYVLMSNTGNKLSWWFHLVYIIDPAIRPELNKIYSDKDFENMLIYAHSKFKWGDLNPSRYWVEAGIRMPLTFHRKSGKPIQTLMFVPKEGLKFSQLHKHWVESESDIDRFVYLDIDRFNYRHEHWADYNRSIKDYKEISKNYGIVKCWTIDQLKFEDVFKQLSEYEYDRTFTVRWKDWNIIKINWEIKLNWTNLDIVDKSTGALYTTNWYKLNKEENYVNSSFSWANHPTRPQGSVLSFLRYYFDNDTVHLEKFLFNKFAIPFKDNIVEDAENVLRTYNSPSNLFTITATKTRVIRTKLFKTKNKQNAQHDTVIDWELAVYAKADTNIDINMMETDITTTVYFARNRNKESVMIYPVASKRDRNRLYQNSIGFFFGDDNDVGMIFNALESIEDIPKVNVISKWWYSEDGIYYLGNKIAGKGKNVITMFPHKEKLHKWENVSFIKYLSSVREVFDDNIAITAMMMAAASCWMNAWDSIIDIANVSPAMFITWETESWKTTLEELIKSAIGYDPNAKYRSTSAGRFSSTAKPFKEACTLYEPIFISEFTNNVNPVIEEGIRNVLNREVSDRGTQSMKNIRYVFRSTLFISWEKMSAEMSVNNRTLTMYLKRSYQKRKKNKDGTDVMLLTEIKKTTPYLEILNSWNKYHNEEWYVRLAYEKALKLLNKKGIDSRTANILAYPLATNSIVYSGLSDEEVADALIRVINKAGVLNTQQSMLHKDATFRLKEMIMQEAIKKKVFVSKKEYNKETKLNNTIYEIVFQSEYINQYWPIIREIVSDINEFVWENVGALLSNTLILSSPVDNIKASSIDRMMAQILLSLRIHHVDYLTENDYSHYRSIL